MAMIIGRDVGVVSGLHAMHANPRRANPRAGLHAFHVGHDSEGRALYVVGDSNPQHRHDEYARMPSGRRALIVQHPGDRFVVTVSHPGRFDTQHRSETRSLGGAVTFAKRYG